VTKKKGHERRLEKYPKLKRSVNLDITLVHPTRSLAATVFHEFGHVLGCGHEYRTCSFLC
jgi:hypothetical protein